MLLKKLMRYGYALHILQNLYLSTMLDRPIPKVIFLDAVGTLFGVAGSVGKQYAKVAQRFGVTLSVEEIDHAFFKSFKAAETCAFPGVEPADLPEKEFRWWFEVAIQTFTLADAIHFFPDFEAFFRELYAYFATAEPWFVYPDVTIALDRWQKAGIPLGIISNFDSRLYAVLKALDLQSYFSSITLSTEVGAAKPDDKVFEAALQKHQCPAKEAWHIGDSFEEDYQAARMVGLRGVWLRR